MPDYFALLGELRRPWLDAEALKANFLARSTESHPDRFHQASKEEQRRAHDRYTEFHTAWSCLREPRDRLRHLIELERGARPGELQEIPPSLMTLFLEVGHACRAADTVFAANSAARSPLLRVALFERTQETREQLVAQQQRVQTWQTALEEQLRLLDAQWQELVPGSRARADLLNSLEELYRLFGYASRWRQQLQDRIVRLT